MTGTRFAILMITAVSVAGCGSTARSMQERDDSGVQASANPDLSMPPDLRLPPPGSAPPPPPQPAPGYDTAYNADAPPAPAATNARYGDDVYAQAGISVNKPDGTRKSEQELRDELRQYYLAKKKQKNPNYGTVFNIGNIFNDE